MKSWFIRVFSAALVLSAGAQCGMAERIPNAVLAFGPGSASSVANMPAVRPQVPAEARGADDANANAPEMQKGPEPPGTGLTVVVPLPSTPTEGAQYVIVPLPSPAPDAELQFVRELELSPAQVAAMRAEIEDDRQKARPLVDQLMVVQRMLILVTLDGRFDEKQVRVLAAKEAHLLQQLIIANTRLEMKLYSMLTEQQRQKVDKLRAEAAAIAAEP
jgi:hypothetical protein